MNKQLSKARIALLVIVSPLMVLALSSSAEASTAYGTLNNFDCVNDVVVDGNPIECHGFEIELDDIHSRDITYTYDYNHYGIPRITEDTFLDANGVSHPRVFIRYAATWTGSAWTAYTAIPSGPITPTNGHQFTNPSVNFGGEHFGAGYYGAPTAVRYYWLIDDGSHNLIHGPPVYVSTPTFTYYPPIGGQPLPQVQAVIVPPPPPAPPVLRFGVATWVKDIKTTTHNPNKVGLRDLVDPDPEGIANDWRNGEPDEVETEWRILQTEFPDLANPDPVNPNGELAGAPEDLPDGDEVITRRYEFYKYIGPIDAESGEAMADAVGLDGIHGDGTVITYNDQIGPDGEWVTVTVNTSTLVIVGDFFGAQMAGFDIAPALGLIDHIPDGELGVPYAERTVVVAGDAAFLATVSGSLPDGTTLAGVTGIFSGTPTVAGAFTFTVEASDTGGAAVSKTYTVTIPDVVPVSSTITTSSLPDGGGSTAGGGTFDNGTHITVVATHNMGYAFANWTEGGLEVSISAVYPFTVNGDRTLVANFILVGCTMDADCADANACTAEACVGGVCEYPPIAGCCNTDAECTDPDACTFDACVNHACTHEAIPACCNTDAECTDPDACTFDACVNHACTHEDIPVCCKLDAECTDPDACTFDACVNHACTHEAIPACCNTDADCADPDACTFDACVNHACSHEDIPDCCTTDSECTDEIDCTTDRCVNQVCRHEANAGCCNTDSQCDDGIACTTDQCVDHACQQTPDDAVCGDTVSCTLDRCVPSVGCIHTPDDSLCDDGLFCNGQERCHTVSGCRPANGKPCPPPFCDEDTNRCSKRMKRFWRSEFEVE